MALQVRREFKVRPVIQGQQVHKVLPALIPRFLAHRVPRAMLAPRDQPAPKDPKVQQGRRDNRVFRESRGQREPMAQLVPKVRQVLPLFW